jgi:outer membrane protein assembly factor BamA
MTVRLRTVLGPILSIGLLALATADVLRADAPRVVSAIRIDGGSEDDRQFAAAALGLKPGQTVDDAGFQQALVAVRLVDRFVTVEGSLTAEGAVLLKLEPLSPVATWKWEGEAVPKALRKTLLPELRKGQRLGPQRRSVLITLAEQRLHEAGYPAATLGLTLEAGGRQARLLLTLGAPSLIRELRIEGDPAPYTREALLKVAGLKPGISLWTPAVAREAHGRLRQRLVKDHRYEGTVRLEPASTPGVMLLEVRPGPKVNLKADGLSLFGPLWGRPRLVEFVPLARAEKYAPSLLEEGAGRITTYFRNQGYPEAKVSYDRVVTAGTADKPELVTITYLVDHGPRRLLGRVSFEGNRELTEAELQKAVELPKRLLVLAPHAKAEAVKAVEDRATALYLQRGFPEVRIRRRVETGPAGTVDVRLIIHEGQRRFLNALVLELPQEPGFNPQSFSQSLLLTISDHPVFAPGRSHYLSDRRHLQAHKGSMESTPKGVQLSFEPPLPLVRNDLALVVSDLRQRLSSAGAAKPQVKLAFEDDGTQSIVRIQIPSQPLDHAKRVVVQGSDRTHAKAVLREVELPPGAPLDPVKLDEGQFQLGGLMAFQRVDLLTLKDLPGQDQQAWQRGDLALRLEERSPWVFTEGFGYDNVQGYHFGLNAQRLNVGGMGRVVDFGIRVGDQTLDSKPMRELFPTGDVKRSLDTFGVGYTDPWFLPGSLDSWLSYRTRFHADAAYIEEAQAAYFARRRRLTSNLEWKLSPVQKVQLGYRFERVEVEANTDSDGNPLLSNEDLFLLARTPSYSVISAPYLQVTVDQRDRPYDPTQGTYFMGRVEVAAQVFGTSPNSSFVKLDLRHQWNWPVGFQAENGVLMATARVGLARPTARTAEDLPLTERFFGGGSFTVRGVEPDMLGEVTWTTGTPTQPPQLIPLGGQAILVLNLEYRFPLFGQSVWGEVFVDSGQVYRTLKPEAGIPTPFPPLRTTPGFGLILKLGFPLKLEYATDWKRIMGQPRSQNERDTQLRGLLISAGFQF